MNMMTVRRWHGYVGVFIAPSVLFFAITGSVQLFGLHEAHGDYQPPAVIEKLGRLHKDQVFTLGRHRPKPPRAAPAAGPQPAAAKPTDDGPRLETTLLKWFFLIVALGLITSTCFGLWIAFTRVRGLRLTSALLVAGAVIPLALVVL